MRRLAIALLLLGAVACGGEPREAKSTETVTSATSPTAANKALVARALDELWQKKNLDAIPTYFASDLVNHGAIAEAQGAKGLRAIGSKLIAAFPDLKMQVDGLTTDGDIVVARVVFEGTQTGQLDFKTPIPATGKHVRIDQVHTFRIKDGRIVEAWMVMDRFDFLTQLGLVPKPANPNGS